MLADSEHVAQNLVRRVEHTGVFVERVVARGCRHGHELVVLREDKLCVSERLVVVLGYMIFALGEDDFLVVYAVRAGFVPYFGVRVKDALGAVRQLFGGADDNFVAVMPADYDIR